MKVDRICHLKGLSPYFFLRFLKKILLKKVFSYKNQEYFLFKRQLYNVSELESRLYYAQGATATFEPYIEDSQYGCRDSRNSSAFSAERKKQLAIARSTFQENTVGLDQSGSQRRRRVARIVDTTYLLNNCKKGSK